MRKFSKKMIAVALSATLIFGSAFSTSAAVKKGTDVSAGKKWTSYSIYTHEDHVNGESEAKKNVCWYHSLINTGKVLDDQHYVTDPVSQSQLDTLNKAIQEQNAQKKTNNPTVSLHGTTWNEQDSHKCFGENASFTSASDSAFNLNVISTGWSANWGPSGQKDSKGNDIYEAKQSNPWGVTATKVVNVERGRYYNISFKIKSTLKNEIKEEKEREDGTYYNVGTGRYNYIKHIHFKAYDDKDEDGAALKLTALKATQGGQSMLETNSALLKDFSSFVKLDSQNTADDGWVTVSCKTFVTASKANYQANKKQATMGIKFAFGAFLHEYKDENDMSGTIEVKDFKVTADLQTPVQPEKVKVKKITKKSATVKFGKSLGSKKYEVQYATKKNFKKGVKKKVSKKTTVKLTKLKAKTKYFVRVRGTMKSGKTYTSPWSKKVSFKTKK